MGAYDLSLEELTATLAGWGEPAFRARQIHRQLWRRAARYEDMTDVPPPLRERLAAEVPLAVEVREERTADGGATLKALLALGPARHLVEVVLMGYRDRITACVSRTASRPASRARPDARWAVAFARRDRWG